MPVPASEGIGREPETLIDKIEKRLENSRYNIQMVSAVKLDLRISKLLVSNNKKARAQRGPLLVLAACSCPNIV